MSKPRRAYELEIKFGANSLDDLIDAVRTVAIDLSLGYMTTAGCSGSPSAGWTYSLSIDEEWTKERYFAALDEVLDK